MTACEPTRSPKKPKEVINHVIIVINHVVSVQV